MASKDIDVRFSKFGTISFTSTTKVNDFIDKLEAGKVSGTVCKGCGTKYFPPRADCCKCLSSNMDWFDVTGTGKLLTYSKLEYAPIGFENDLPYCIAVVDFGEYKVFGRISGDIADSEIKGGMELKVVVNKLPNGQLNYVFEKA
jgi:uncharacterized OB-fold protein